jgi:hypothetical protein
MVAAAPPTPSGGVFPGDRTLRASEGFSCNQWISARQILAQYPSSGTVVGSAMASSNFGAASPRLCMLEVPLDDAEVGRWEAEAICASVRATSVKPSAQ